MRTTTPDPDDILAYLGEDDAPLPPARRLRRRLPWLRMALGSAIAVAGLAFLAHERQGASDEAPAGPVPPPVLLAPPSPWEALPRANPAFAIEGVQNLAFAARRHASGGREDVLTVRAFGEPGHAWLRLRRGIQEPAPESAYIDLVRLAAQAGLAVVRVGRTERIETKLGPAETAVLTLSGAGEQVCRSIRLATSDIALTLQGFLCGDGPPVPVSDLACLVDRLVATGIDDAPLRVLFAHAERRRMDACGPPPRPSARRG